MSRSARFSWALACLGLVLAVGLLVLAQPADVIALARRARLPWLLAAFGGTVVAMALRGLRLSLLTNLRLAPLRAVAVAAASQLATGVLPARIGEVSLIPLLSAAGMPGAIRALSLIVLVRILDVSSVLVWAAVGVAAIGGKPVLIAAALAAVAGALAAAWILGTRTLRHLATGWRGAAGWRRRTLRQFLRVRRELLQLSRAPLRAAAGVLVSLLLWGVIWAVTLVLIGAMGLDWPPVPVLLGVVGAAFGSSLPINAAGNFGTQEAGWAAALTSVGVAPRSALAAGFACHLWGLVFTLAIGAVSVVYLAARRSRAPSAPILASVRRLFKPGRDE